MKKMLITGGTVFVSRYATEFFIKNYEVYVLNRNSKLQSSGVTLIEADSHNLNNIKKISFRFVLDITAYFR